MDEKYSLPKLPVEINVDNWNTNQYYFQSQYIKWKPPYSARNNSEEYFKALGYATWRVIWPEIADWVNKNGGWNHLKIEYQLKIYTAIMMNIEFLRCNKVVEQNMVRTLTLNNFNVQSTPNQYYSDKTIVGEACWSYLTKLGILRMGMY